MELYEADVYVVALIGLFVAVWAAMLLLGWRRGIMGEPEQLD
jgi:ABC-type transporter Mla subunit MlaD